jgi:hypothetical protein
MSFTLQYIADPTARALLAQLLKRNLMPVAVGMAEAAVASPLTGNGSQASPISIPSPLPIANGGTGGTSAPTAGGIAYGNGTKHAFTAAGTAGQLLRSGGAGAPTWLTLPPSLALAVLEADVSTDTEAGISISPAWRWDLTRYQVLSLHAQLAVLGTSLSAPRVGIFCDIAGEWPAANGLIRALTFSGGATVPAFAHLPVGAWTSRVTSGVPTTITIWTLDAVLAAPDDGRFAIYLASSEEGDAAQVLAGSFVESSVLTP